LQTQTCSVTIEYYSRPRFFSTPFLLDPSSHDPHDEPAGAAVRRRAAADEGAATRVRREALVEVDVRRDAAGVGQVAWRQDDAVRRAAVGGDPQATGSGIREPTPTRNHRDHRFTNLQQNWDLTSWQRGLGRKRLLAVREFALGVEALERFVRAEPLRRVHECVFGVLASESEAVDPRL